MFNYVAILVGAMPPASQSGTARLVESAGRHFNRGQRASLFALGYLGWFVGPWVLFFATALVVVVTWPRQFASNAWRAVGSQILVLRMIFSENRCTLFRIMR